MSTAEDQDNMVSRFRAAVVSVGGHFASARDLSAVRDYVNNLALGLKVKRIVVSATLPSELFSPPAAQVSFQIVSQAKMSRKEFFTAITTAEIGVSTVDLAVAETGTLIVATSDEAERLVTALPKIHVAVLPRSKLFFSLQDAEPHVSQMLTTTRGGVAISMISATSRTTDIGGMVVLGVHGPRDLHVLLLAEELARVA